MPVYNIEIPGKGTYSVDSPSELTDIQAYNAANQQALAEERQLKEHETKTGFIPAVKAGAREFLGGTEQALGMSELAEEQFKKARETSQGTTQEDIERAKAKGILPAAGAYLEKYVGEPLGGMLGRFGAPIAAGMAAPAIAPEAAIGALGTAGVAAAGTALTDFLPEMGENIKAQKDAGKDPNYVTAALIGGVQASVAALGVPGTGAINKVLGPRLVEEAKVLAPKIVEGEISLDAAKEALTGKWTQYAQNMAVNTATNTGLMVGTEELRRAQAGQDLMSGREIAETAGQAALLSPIFGAMHLGGPRAEAETILQAGKIKYDKIQDQLSSLRDLAQTRELSRQENIKVAELQQQARDIQLEMQRVTEANQANNAANKVYEAQQKAQRADYIRPLKEQMELPLGKTPEDLKAKELEGGAQKDLFTEPAETPAPTQEPYTITNKMLSELGVGRSAYPHKAIVGFNANDPTQNKIIRNVLDEHANKNGINPKTAARIEAFLNDELPKIGDQNVNGQSELKLEGNRDGVSGSDVGRSKPTEGAAQTNTGAVESSGDATGEPLGGEGKEPAALTNKPKSNLIDYSAEYERYKRDKPHELAEIDAAIKEPNFNLLGNRLDDMKKLLDEYLPLNNKLKSLVRPRTADQARRNKLEKDILEMGNWARRATGDPWGSPMTKLSSLIADIQYRPYDNSEQVWKELSTYVEELKARKAGGVKSVTPETQEVITGEAPLGAYYNISDKEQRFQQQIPQEGQLKVKPNEYVKPADRLTPTSFMDRLNHPDPNIRQDARIELFKTIREERNIERSRQESEVAKNMPPENDSVKRVKYLIKNLEQIEDAPRSLIEDLKNSIKKEVDPIHGEIKPSELIMKEHIDSAKDFLINHRMENVVDKILKRKATPEEVEAFNKLQDSLFRYEPKKLGKNKESEFAKDPEAYNAMIDAFIEDYTGKREPLLPKTGIESDDSLPNRFNISEGEAATIKITEGAKTYGEAMDKFNDYFGPHISKPLQEVIKRLLNTPSLRNIHYKMEKQVMFKGEAVAGLFTPTRSLNGKGTIRISLNNTNEFGVLTLVHEGVHAATIYEVYNHISNLNHTKPYEKIPLEYAKTETGRRLIKLFNRAYERSFKENLPSGIDSKYIYPKMYAFANMHEFIAEAFSNEKFQKYLAAQDGIEPITGRKSLWQDFIQAVKDVLGFGNIENSLLANIIDASHPLFKGKVSITRAEARASALKKQPEPNERLNDLFKKAGGTEAPKDPGLFHSAYNTVKELNKDKTNFLQKILDKTETNFFSSNAAFSNKLIRNMEKEGLSWDAMKKVLYQIADGQTLHREALAHQFIIHGGLEYRPDEYKYVVTDNPHSWGKMISALDEAAKLNGIPLAEMQKYAGQALIARRYGTVDGEFGNGIVARNKVVDDHVRDLLVRNMTSDAEAYRAANRKLVHLSEAEIDSGLKLFKELKGMDKVVEQWNKTRENTMKVMVDSGLYNKIDAEILLDAIEYVPFYRVEQLDNRAGPKEFSRGIVDLARDRKFRGSEKEINNVFDNMERWVSYSIRKSIGNKTATALVKAALEHMPDEVREVPKVGTGKRENTTGIWVDGEVKHYEFDDPLFVHAFTGMEPIVIPALSTFAKFTNMLRKNIVLNPLFSIGQLSQDGFNAMITSGVKHPFAIPVEVFKEFVKTLRGTSAAHEELTARGATGAKDYSSAISRIEAEIESNLKEASGFEKNVLKPAEKLSMASDNAVRQAIYNRTLLETGGKKVGNRIEGGDKALAVERALEVINFRRSGASSSVNFLRQTVPFFGAYLQALNVTGKVLLGRGIAPAQKAEARKVLASTMAKVAIAGLIYNMMVSDDDGYKKLDPSVRDRRLVIPGTDGLSLPLRSDLFTYLTKIVPEHVYQMNLDQGAEDGTKAAKALKMGLINAIASPNVMPQAIKPIFEVSLNKDFYTGRDIVGQGIAERNTQDQYTPNTSELAKVLGSKGAMSPMKIDYLLKAYFGYTAGLGLMAVDKVIAASEDKSPPEKSFRDFIASVPGASAFVSHEFGNKDITDFYELRDMVNTTVNSYNFRKSYGTPEETKEYREENKQLLQVQTQVNNINRNLTNIRHQETAILQKPDSVMSPEVKGVKIRELRLRQQKMLANIDDLRKRAGL